MVPVRKPGRPLSACPHPPSKLCSCAAVTAAIPRKQKCSCGPAAQTEPKPNDTPVSPTSKSTTGKPGAFRVDKSTRSGPSRKQSVDITGLERMDSSQLNIISPSSALPSTTSSSTNGDHGLTTSSNGISNGNGLHSSVQSSGPGNGALMESDIKIEDTLLADHSMSAVSSVKSSSQNGTTGGGCCQNSDAAPQNGTSPPESVVDSNSSATGEIKSCCSTRPEPPVPNQQPQHRPPHLNGNAPYGVMMPPAQIPMMMPPAVYPYFPPPTIFTYPPQYGSYMQPLQPEQWRQFMAAMYFSQAAPSIPYTPPPIQTGQFNNAPQPLAGTSHECGCGDGCQCVGCAAHPYNEATQSYVRSAWNSMFQEGQNGTVTANLGNDQTPLSTNGAASISTPTQSQLDANSTTSPAPPTPSDGASNMSEDQQQLSANDFFFVTYPFDDGCAGDTASCPCGDDCQCIGCVIHGNSSSIDAAAAEA